MPKKTIIFLLGTFLFAFLILANEGEKNMKIFSSSKELKWVPAPEILPKGAEMALLYGNPEEKGPFVIRLKMPANYRIQPHWHPDDENITVLSGSFNIGMGKTFDEKEGTKLSPDGFLSIPKEMGHYAWTTEPTVIQLNNQGPWKLIYYDNN